MQYSNMYASSNPFLNDTVNASMRSARRQVFEGDIPSARLASAGKVIHVQHDCHERRCSRKRISRTSW